ncbi:hypothetical protein COHA_009924 [Chlorella ohadii]|uniref:Uncharacterized protein n=1 Tax=Chlorella ohadii TaxID=2649997 RepID=A0AAD5DGU5_9CHLO|nr:hypothetical protein COHA_009924 [Chlorella ohadii]
MLERIVSWRGCSRIIVGYSCGLEAAPGSRLEWSTQAALFGVAAGWQLRPHLFTAAKQQFEPDDVDKFELLICLDSSIQAEVLKQLSAARPAHPASYTPRICCLTDFLMYCPDDVLLRIGSTALLDRQLRGAVQLALPALRPSAARIAAAAAAAAETAGGGSAAAATSSGEGLPAVAVPAYMLPTGIPRPPLSAGSYDAGEGECADPEGCTPDEQWERMALLTAVCCAGLVQYLLDLYPLSDDTGLDD